MAPWASPILFEQIDGSQRCEAFNETVPACHHYYWGKHLLQRNFRFLPLGELKRQVDVIYSEVGVEGCLFIRPDDNFKSFAGSVVPRERFDRWLSQNVSCYDLLPSLLCLVSAPQQILGEWRLVVTARQVLTASAYVAENAQAALRPCLTRCLPLHAASLPTTRLIHFLFT